MQINIFLDRFRTSMKYFNNWKKVYWIFLIDKISKIPHEIV
jgi:hypothetical protein